MDESGDRPPPTPPAADLKAIYDRARLLIQLADALDQERFLQEEAIRIAATRYSHRHILEAAGITSREYLRILSVGDGDTHHDPPDDDQE